MLSHLGDLSGRRSLMPHVAGQSNEVVFAREVALAHQKIMNRKVTNS